METIIKGFIGVFFSVLLVVIGMQFLMASLEARRAQSFMAEVTERISASHFSKGVMEACRTDASRAGYSLQLDVLSRGNSGVYYGTATMEYDFSLPLFGIEKKHQLQADLR